MTKHQANATEGVIEFLRKKDYILVRELGQGACGKTVLLRDDGIGEQFVCKKYAPFSEAHRESLFQNFVNEIKLLLRANHPNIVRVFNYYLFPERFAGFILMEHVDGQDIETFLSTQPERTNDVFVQVIDGFRYLESNQILHRDIRPANILVRADGVVKIIDLGFSKRIAASKDFGKSISLNWWCDPPPEFLDSTYDFRTEVYFVGTLFEQLISRYDIEHFKYSDLLRRMCAKDPTQRLPSFSEAEREVQNDRFDEIDFSDNELNWYRAFADEVTEHITKIKRGTKYVDDLDRLRSDLDAVYRKCMLEQYVPDARTVLSCVLTGDYYYRQSGFEVESLKGFIRLLKSVTNEKRRIIGANLHTRLDAIPRYDAREDSKDDFDDIPF